MRSTNILIFLVAINAAAGLVGAVGLTDSGGFDPTFGQASEDIEEVQNESESQVASDRGAFDSFVGAVISAASTLTSFFSVFVAAPQMLINLGVPGAIVGFVAAPLYIVVAIDLLGVISGRDLT